MGFLDDAKEKLTELASQHPDQVESLSDQALERGVRGRHIEHRIDGGRRRAGERWRLRYAAGES